MKKSRRFHSKKKEPEKYRSNEKIFAPELEIIDENGGMLGVMKTAEAFEMAKERGFDLIEVSPKAEPPVAKFMDYGRFKYLQEKQSKKHKTQQKKTDIKGIRLSPRIGQHDLDVRIKKAEEFLEKGHKIKLEMNLRGREHQHLDLAKQIINDIIEKLGEDIEIEQPVAKEGGRLTTTIRRKG